MSRSKRRWITFGALVASAGLLAGCASGAPTSSAGATSLTAERASSTAPVQLTYVSNGGTGQAAQEQAWQVPYTKKHPNVTFLNTTPDTPALVQAQVQAKQVNWNIVTTAPYLASQSCGTIYQPLKIPNLDKKDFAPGEIGKCYITDFRYALVLSYNANKWPNPKTAPHTLADFFNEKKFPGKRGVVPTVQDGMLETALLADGVKPKDMYPLNVTKALNTWDKIKSDTLFAPNVGALEQAVASQQVDMQIMVSSRTQAALNSGVNIVPVWDKTVTSIDGLAIPKGSPNVATAEDFMSFLLQPAQQTQMAQLAGVAPSNLKAKPEYTPNGEEVNAFGKANTGTTFQVDANWWSMHYNQIQAEVTNWLNG